MGSVMTRKRKNGTTSYTGQIVIWQDKTIVHRENKTFDRMTHAQTWIKRREAELAEPGALTALKDPRKVATLGHVISHYLTDTKSTVNRNKMSVLLQIKAMPIADMRCDEIGSPDLMEWITELGLTRRPQTVKTFVSHLSGIFGLARPAWGYQLDERAIHDAVVAARRLGMTAPASERTRRPTLDELNRLMDYFEDREEVEKRRAPMTEIVLFAIFSTRRMGEIVRIDKRDLDGPEHIWVRGMKDPRKAGGRDTLVRLPAEAQVLIGTRPEGTLYDYSNWRVSTLFTEACRFLGIDDLHFHDLRHEGISRLFELGWTIPQVAEVSGHRSWVSLKRYTQMRQKGDKFAGWRWLPQSIPNEVRPANPLI